MGMPWLTVEVRGQEVMFVLYHWLLGQLLSRVHMASRSFLAESSQQPPLRSYIAIHPAHPDWTYCGVYSIDGFQKTINSTYSFVPAFSPS